MRRPLVGCAAIVVTLGLAACGGSGGGDTTTTVNVPGTTIGGFRVAQTFVVHETESKLSPHRFVVPRFGYYGFKAVNDGTATHALEITGKGVHAHTGDIAPGDSAEFAVLFKRSGTYKLFDPLDGNRAKGMEGTVRVP